MGESKSSKAAVSYPPLTGIRLPVQPIRLKPEIRKELEEVIRGYLEGKEPTEVKVQLMTQWSKALLKTPNSTGGWNEPSRTQGQCQIKLSELDGSYEAEYLLEALINNNRFYISMAEARL